MIICTLGTAGSALFETVVHRDVFFIFWCINFLFTVFLEEMNAQWDIPLHVDTSLAAFVRGVLPATTQTTDSSSGGSNNRSDGGSQTSADKRHHSGDGRHMPGTAAVSIILSCMTLQSYIG